MLKKLCSFNIVYKQHRCHVTTHTTTHTRAHPYVCVRGRKQLLFLLRIWMRKKIGFLAPDMILIRTWHLIENNIYIYRKYYFLDALQDVIKNIVQEVGITLQHSLLLSGEPHIP